MVAIVFSRRLKAKMADVPLVSIAVSSENWCILVRQSVGKVGMSCVNILNNNGDKGDCCSKPSSAFLGVGSWSSVLTENVRTWNHQEHIIIRIQVGQFFWQVYGYISGATLYCRHFHCLRSHCNCTPGRPFPAVFCSNPNWHIDTMVPSSTNCPSFSLMVASSNLVVPFRRLIGCKLGVFSGPSLLLVWWR